MSKKFDPINEKGNEIKELMKKEQLASYSYVDNDGYRFEMKQIPKSGLRKYFTLEQTKKIMEGRKK